MLTLVQKGERRADHGFRTATDSIHVGNGNQASVTVQPEVRSLAPLLGDRQPAKLRPLSAYQYHHRHAQAPFIGTAICPRRRKRCSSPGDRGLLLQFDASAQVCDNPVYADHICGQLHGRGSCRNHPDSCCGTFTGRNLRYSADSHGALRRSAIAARSLGSHRRERSRGQSR
jgi:hypothetical protein